MTPAERAALRELMARSQPWLLSNDAELVATARSAIPALLDDCDRLERTVELQRAVIAENDVDAKRLTKERDEARQKLRGIWEVSEDCRERWPELRAVIATWDAEDAQAAKKAGDA